MIFIVTIRNNLVQDVSRRNNINFEKCARLNIPWEKRSIERPINSYPRYFCINHVESHANKEDTRSTSNVINTLMFPVLLLLTPLLSLITSQTQNCIDGEGLGLLLLLLLRVLHVRDGVRMRHLRRQVLRRQLRAEQMRTSHTFQSYGLEIGISRLHLQVSELLVLQYTRIFQQCGTTSQSLERQAADVVVPHSVQRKVEFLHTIEAVVFEQTKVFHLFVHHKIDVLTVPVQGGQRCMRAPLLGLAQIKQHILGGGVLGSAERRRRRSIRRFLALVRSVQRIVDLAQVISRVTVIFGFVQRHCQVPRRVLARKLVESHGCPAAAAAAALETKMKVLLFRRCIFLSFVDRQIELFDALVTLERSQLRFRVAAVAYAIRQVFRR